MAYWHLLCLRHFVIGLNISRHFVIQSEVKPKPIVTPSHTFSRSLRPSHVFASSSDWFIGFSVSFATFSSKLKISYGFLTSLLSSSKLTLNVGSSRANRLRAFENCAKSF